jgi:hypothetical protein
MWRCLHVRIAVLLAFVATGLLPSAAPASPLEIVRVEARDCFGTLRCVEVGWELRVEDAGESGSETFFLPSLDRTRWSVVRVEAELAGSASYTGRFDPELAGESAGEAFLSISVRDSSGSPLLATNALFALACDPEVGGDTAVCFDRSAGPTRSRRFEPGQMGWVHEPIEVHYAWALVLNATPIDQRLRVFGAGGFQVIQAPIPVPEPSTAALLALGIAAAALARGRRRSGSPSDLRNDRRAPQTRDDGTSHSGGGDAPR